MTGLSPNAAGVDLLAIHSLADDLSNIVRTTPTAQRGSREMLQVQAMRRLTDDLLQAGGGTSKQRAKAVKMLARIRGK